MNPTIKISTSLNILRLCLALFCIEHTISQKTESWSSTLQEAITQEFFVFLLDSKFPNGKSGHSNTDALLKYGLQYATHILCTL